MNLIIYQTKFGGNPDCAAVSAVVSLRDVRLRVLHPARQPVALRGD
jgi:hypothetical protein